MQTSRGFNLTRADINKIESDLINKMIRRSKIKIRIKDQNQKHQIQRPYLKTPKGINI